MIQRGRLRLETYVRVKAEAEASAQLRLDEAKAALVGLAQHPAGRGLGCR